MSAVGIGLSWRHFHHALLETCLWKYILGTDAHKVKWSTLEFLKFNLLLYFLFWYWICLQLSWISNNCNTLIIFISINSLRPPQIQFDTKPLIKCIYCKSSFNWKQKLGNYKNLYFFLSTVLLSSFFAIILGPVTSWGLSLSCAGNMCWETSLAC